jgi:hypothetical protein
MSNRPQSDRLNWAAMAAGVSAQLPAGPATVDVPIESEAVEQAELPGPGRREGTGRPAGRQVAGR